MPKSIEIDPPEPTEEQLRAMEESSNDILDNAQARKMFIGIDPGASGGIAFIDGEEVEVYAMPATLKDIWLLLSQDGGEPFAMIEGNTGYAGGPGEPGSAMFKFGHNTGALEMALTALGIPYVLVSPQKWQGAFGIPPRKKSVKEKKHAFKNRLKGTAQRLIPGIKLTAKTADAALIALYCKRMKGGS